MMEPLMGGDLFDAYNDNNLFGSIKHAKFYIACVTMGLQHMHLNRVVYRDLKLENCILSDTGYLKLTDMGIAKVVIGKTYTICGTTDYFAPETLKQAGHDRAVDWWACGVLLFIMVVGRSPFDAPEQMQIYKNIMKGFSKVQFPETTPSDLADVVKSLCRKQPEERVTMQKGGVQSLQAMPFFSGFAWEDLANKKMEAVLVPPPWKLEKFAAKKSTQGEDFSESMLLDWDGSLAESSS
jgi:serine/threonine protein kinase